MKMGHLFQKFLGMKTLSLSLSQRKVIFLYIKIAKMFHNIIHSMVEVNSDTRMFYAG